MPPVSSPASHVVNARMLQQLQAVYGDCIPKENAAALLEHSPAAPSSPAELQGLRALLVDAAGKKLSELAAAAGITGTPASSSTASRTLPSGTAIQLAQVQAARDLRTPDGLHKTLTEKKATALFHEIAAMADIPHTFLEDGCLFRAHVIGKRLEDKGIFSEKILTIPLGGDLIMDTPKARLGYTVVWYHEAISVHVQTKDGIERRVLDPSVGDKPLTVEEWRAGMKGTNNAPLETFVLPRFSHGLGDRDKAPTAYDEAELKDAFEWCREGWKESQQGYVDMGFYDGEGAKLAGR